MAREVNGGSTFQFPPSEMCTRGRSMLVRSVLWKEGSYTVF